MARVVIPGFRKIEVSGGGEGGTTNYNELTNKPSINNVQLVGNLNTVDLKLTDKTLTEEGVPAEAKTVGTKFEEQSTSLTALSEQLGNHTVKSDVPENAVFTDTVYDDTKIQKRISDNGYGEVAGGKNLAIVSSFSTSNNEIIFTKKDDSTLIANGSNYNGGVGLNKFLAKAGITYTAQIITDLQLNMFIWNSDENILVVSPTSSTEISFSVAKDTNISVAIDANNVVFNNTEIKVQLEEGSEATEYEPYFPSNKMLAEEKADKSETTVNRLNPKLQTTTKDGITCTNNGDGTYTLNGTAVSTTYFSVQGITYLAKKTKNKEYKLVGCPTGGINKYDLRYEINGSTANGGGKDFGDGVIIKNDKINSTDITSAEIIIAVLKGVTVNNLVFKPMLTTNLNATYDDFVPYTGDSGSLNGDVAKLKNDLDGFKFVPFTNADFTYQDSYKFWTKTVSDSSGKNPIAVVVNATNDNTANLTAVIRDRNTIRISSPNYNNIGSLTFTGYYVLV